MVHWVVVRNYSDQWEQDPCSSGMRSLALTEVDMEEHILVKGFPGGSLNVEGGHYKVVCKVVAIHCTLALPGVGVLWAPEVELVVEEMTLDLDTVLKMTSRVQPCYVDIGMLVGSRQQKMEVDSCGVQMATKMEVSHFEVQNLDWSNEGHVKQVVASDVT
jgi:hypothetical protein